MIGCLIEDVVSGVAERFSDFFDVVVVAAFHFETYGTAVNGLTGVDSFVGDG